MRRPLVLAIAGALLALALPGGAAGQDTAALPDIEDEVMCTICGTPLEHSFSPQADRERDFIRRLIAEGRSKDEIKDALVAEYGEDVLATPDDEGFDLAAWLLPIAGLAAAVIALAVWLRRRRPDPEGDQAPAPLEDADARRLREDMARHEV
ncbi:MAG TPA: cytochrome c-type biogenesis protein CcmH [Solirubrobacterales bacterium]|nr:cytochrome c-type biogenesis protein CcmH [Solirubrobacterales bacterium]